MSSAMTKPRCIYTLAEWQKLPPYQQGFVLYMEGERLPELKGQTCPYHDGTPEHDEFMLGQQRAVLVAQDSEE